MKFLLQTVLIIVELLVFAATSDGAKGVTEVHSFGSDTRPEGGGTVVCVGTNEAGCIFFLTAKHITHGATSYKVRLGDKWVKAKLIRAHDTLDIAMIGTATGTAVEGLQWPDVAEELPEIGTPIKMAGYGGPMFGGTPIERQGQVKEYVLIRERRENGGSWQKFRSTDVGPVIDAGIYSGDSGGGYFDENDNLLGIVSAFVNDKIDNKRLMAVSCVEIRKWYEECQWSCPPCRNGRCPPQQQQFQRQPPIIVSPPVQTIPPPQVSPPPPSNTGLTIEDVKQIVNEALDGIEVINGVDGKDGEDGVDGNPGPRGQQGIGIVRLWIEAGSLMYELTDGTVGDAGQLPGNDEDWKRRVLLVNGTDGTIIDDESYGKDEPIVIDVNRLDIK